MRKNQKIVAGGTALLLALGLGVAAVGSTSAYFSDTNFGGYVSADLGSIRVDVNGNPITTPVLTFSNILPGEVHTGTFTVTNTGTNTQDVYMTFPDPDEVAGINDLGSYGEIWISFGGTEVWHSDNLNDAYPNDPSVRPLPNEIYLGSLEAGASATVEFSFKYGEQATIQSPIPATLHYNIVGTQPGITPSDS